MTVGIAPHVLERMKGGGMFEPPSDPPPDESFFRALRASRLLSDADADALESCVRADPAADPHAVFVGSGKLTPYQYERLRRGEPERLVIGPYVVLDELGRGGGGKVFKANHALLGRVVALKVIDPRYSEERGNRVVFRREVAAATRLDHPNIARLYDADEADGTLYLAMECVDGPTLHRYTHESGGMAPGLAAAVMVQAADALQHAHDNGLVHRDIKPANIMFPGAVRRPDGESPLVKIVDFGLARLFGEHDLSTIQCPEGAAMGTPAFMAPEQIRNVHAADIRSDLYALGCSFYFVLSGRLPFEGASTRGTLAMHLEQEPPSLRSVCPSVPAALARIVHRLMAKNPADRYQTPAELAAALTDTILSGALSEPAAVSRPAVRPRGLALSPASHDQTPPPAVPTGAADLPPLALVALRWNWVRWREVIEACVSGQPPQVSADEYKVIYRALLAAVRDARVGSAVWESRLDRLQAAAEPWVTLQSLTSTDPHTRAELWQLCSAFNALFSPSAPARGHGGSGGFVAVGLVAAVAAGLWWVLDCRPDLAAPVTDLVGVQPFVAAVALVLGAFLAAFVRGGSHADSAGGVSDEISRTRSG